MQFIIALSALLAVALAQQCDPIPKLSNGKLKSKKTKNRDRSTKFQIKFYSIFMQASSKICKNFKIVINLPHRRKPAHTAQLITTALTVALASAEKFEAVATKYKFCISLD